MMGVSDSRFWLLTMLISVGYLPRGLTESGEIPDRYRQVSREYRVPADTLYRLAMRQSATTLSNGDQRPWPWTIAVAGRRIFYHSQTAAYQAAQQHLQRGHRISVGLLQLDWQEHGASLGSSWNGLDPLYNLRIGARLLKQYFTKTRNWDQAGEHFRKTDTKALVKDKSLPFDLNASGHLQFAPTVRTIAAKHQLSPALLLAVIAAESNYDPQARSHAGAQGLMQLMPATAARFAVSDPYDPASNIEGGARYLRWLLDEFDDLPLALAGYNAGENAVIRNGYRIPPYRETQRYVPRVLAFYHYFLQRESG